LERLTARFNDLLRSARRRTRNGSSSSSVTRGVYDLDATQLRPLPLAAEEAQ